MSKKIIALCLALVMVLSMTACSAPAQTAEPEQTAEPATKASTAETPTADARPVIGSAIQYDPNVPINDGKDIEVELWFWSGAANLFQSLADQYTAIHPNVTITLVENPWDDYFTKLPLALQGNDGPAIFNVHNSKHDLLIDYMAPYDIPVEDMEADFVGVSGHLVDGKVYYTDYGLMTATMYYNTDMWAAAGLTEADIPTTWDEFREVAKKLTIRDENGDLVQAGFSYNGGIQGDVLGMQYQYGQNLFNEDGTGNIAENDVLKKCVEIYAQMVADGTLVEVTDWDQYIASMNDGKAAGVINGCWIMSSVQAAEDQSGKWAIVDMPKLDGIDGATNYANCGGASWAVSSNCKNTALAFDFLKSTFGSSVELYDDLLPNAGAISSYLPAAESDVYNQPSEFYGGQTVYKDIVEFAGKVPAFDCGAYYSDVRSALTDAVTNIVQNNADIDSEMQNAQDTVEFNIAG